MVGLQHANYTIIKIIMESHLQMWTTHKHFVICPYVTVS
jgi:hypothetical protein